MTNKCHMCQGKAKVTPSFNHKHFPHISLDSVHIAYSSLVVWLSAFDPGARGPGSSHGWKHCVVFLGKTLYCHGASPHPGV